MLIFLKFRAYISIFYAQNYFSCSFHTNPSYYLAQGDNQVLPVLTKIARWWWWYGLIYAFLVRVFYPLLAFMPSTLRLWLMAASVFVRLNVQVCALYLSENARDSLKTFFSNIFQTNQSKNPWKEKQKMTVKEKEQNQYKEKYMISVILFFVSQFMCRTFVFGLNANFY